MYECEEPCGYFEDRKALVNFDAMPSPQEYFSDLDDCTDERILEKASLAIFDILLETGFRRSGNFVYLNLCPDCKQCIPIRIKVRDYNFNKKERRILRKNNDITLKITTERDELITQEKIDLFSSYMKRHQKESEADLSFGKVKEMLVDMNGFTDAENRFCGAINFDYYLGDKLIGCSLIDMGLKSFSSNYFYYSLDDEIMKRSIGNYSILREIQFCRDNNIKYYYLGYYIENCRKMNYKGSFKPHELLLDGDWVDVAL